MCPTATTRKIKKTMVESKTQGNQRKQPSPLPTLESHNRIRQNQRHPKSHENAWPQKRQNTMFYTQMVNFENDEYHSATAATVQDAQKLVEAGFEYVCDFNEVKVFRKPK